MMQNAKACSCVAFKLPNIWKLERQSVEDMISERGLTFRWKQTSPKRGGADSSKRASLRMSSATVSARRMWCLYKRSNTSGACTAPANFSHTSLVYSSLVEHYLNRTMHHIGSHFAKLVILAHCAHPTHRVAYLQYRCIVAIDRVIGLKMKVLLLKPYGRILKLWQ